MSADRTRLRLFALLVVTLLAVTGLAACSDNDGEAKAAGRALPTTAPGDSSLLCGILPRASVATALGRKASDLEATGELTKDAITGHSNGKCRIASKTESAPALSAEVLWPSAEERDLVRTLIGKGTPYTFPDSYAPGVGFYNGPGSDVQSQAVARVIWGDYVVSVVDDEPAAGRDALTDSVALVHQIIDALDLPKTPPAGAASPSP